MCVFVGRRGWCWILFSVQAPAHTHIHIHILGGTRPHKAAYKCLKAKKPVPGLTRTGPQNKNGGAYMYCRSAIPMFNPTNLRKYIQPYKK